MFQPELAEFPFSVFAVMFFKSTDLNALIGMALKTEVIIECVHIGYAWECVATGPNS